MNTVNLQDSTLQNSEATNANTSGSAENSRRERSRSERVYHEIPGLRHETRDVLKQLESNVQLLEDLTARLGYVLFEVRSLIRR